MNVAPMEKRVGPSATKKRVGQFEEGRGKLVWCGKKHGDRTRLLCVPRII